jgi:diguanylate cyclase (GGDEF)-like protein/PAS domain S-box-containing protein
MKIQGKSVLSHLAASLGAILLVLALSFMLLRQSMQSMVSEQLEAQSTDTMTLAVSLLEEMALDFDSWSTLFSMQDALIDDDGRAIQLEIETLLKRFDLFAELFVVNEKGKVIATTQPRLKNVNVKNEPYFKSAIQGKPYQDHVRDYSHMDDMGLLMARPIRASYDENTVIGALVGVLNWQKMRDVLGRLTVLGELQNEKMGLVLVDVKNSTVLYGEAWFRPGFLSSHDFEAQHERGTSHSFKIDGTPFLHGTSKSWGTTSSEDPGWQIHAVAEVDAAYAPITRLRNRILFVGLLSALMAGLLGYGAASHLARPISQITAALKRVAAGDANVSLTLGPRNDEIGEMAETLQVFRDHVLSLERLSLEKSQAEEKSRLILSDAIEALVQPVAVWDSNDRFVFGNSRFEELIAPEHLLGRKLQAGHPYFSFLREIAEKGRFLLSGDELNDFIEKRLAFHLEASGSIDMPHRDGQVVRVAERRTKSGGIVSTYFDITEFKRRETAMNMLISAKVEGHNYAEAAAMALAKGLEFHTAGLSLLNPDGTSSHVQAQWKSSHFINDYTYELDGTPCFDVISRHELFCVERGVCQLYPRDTALASIGAQSYVGIPFFSGKGALIGHLFAVDTKPIQLSEELSQMLNMIARWVEAEYEKETAETSLRKLSRAVEQSPVSVVITDINGIIEYVNPRFIAVSGYTPEEVIGQNPRVLKSGQIEDEVYKNLWDTISQGGEWRGELLNKKKDGSLYWENVLISPVRGHDGKVANFVAVKEDITLFKRYQERLVHQAHYDSLTDLPNRRLALERLGAALTNIGQSGRKLALLFIDLDRFKDINDTLGHAVGDVILRQAASRLSLAVGSGRMIARLGGDEFLLMLPDLHDVEEAEHMASRVVNIFAEPFFHGERELYLTASVGITYAPDQGADADQLLQNADAAMYRAKESGRNQWLTFTPELLQATARRVALETALRHALERQEFELAYQPLIEAKSGLLIGAEALLRWESTDLGSIPPDHFVNIAEETNLIVPIGEWVIAEACRTIKAWSDQAGRPLVIAINVASNQFRGHGLVESVQRAIAENGLAPDQIDLEITERLILEDSIDCSRTLKSLKDMGVHLSIDDFGTGYSSFSYLTRFPLDTLKIDRSFVSQVDNDASSAMLTRAIIAMAHGLGLKVVAEGVEMSSQRDFLIAEDCDFLQGYLYSKPLKAEPFRQKFVSDGKVPV